MDTETYEHGGNSLVAAPPSPLVIRKKKWLAEFRPQVSQRLVLNRPVGRPNDNDVPGLDKPPAAIDGGNAADLVPHALAEIFPVMADEALKALAHDIGEHGLLEPIVLYEGRILDGRCRHKACLMAAVKPRFERFVGEDPLGYVVSRNALRRHLAEGQRAMVGARLATMGLGANQYTAEGVPIGRAAELLNVSKRSIARAKLVLQRGIPGLVTAVESSNLSISTAEKIARLTAQKQREALARPLIPAAEKMPPSQGAANELAALRAQRDELRAIIRSLEAQLTTSHPEVRCADDRSLRAADLHLISDLASIDDPLLLDVYKLLFLFIMREWRNSRTLQYDWYNGLPVVQRWFIDFLRTQVGLTNPQDRPQC